MQLASLGLASHVKHGCLQAPQMSPACRTVGGRQEVHVVAKPRQVLQGGVQGSQLAPLIIKPGLQSVAAEEVQVIALVEHALHTSVAK